VLSDMAKCYRVAANGNNENDGALLMTATPKSDASADGDRPPAASQLEGACLSIVTLPHPWPPRAPVILFRNEALTLVAESTGCLTAQVTAGDEVFRFTSCRLILSKDAPTTTNIGASWRLPAIMNVVVGRNIVLSTEDQSQVPPEVHVVSGVPNDVRDFSKENIAALEGRRRRLERVGQKPGRRSGGKEYAFQALQDEHRQISDLLDHIRRGQTYHVPGLLARVRLLIADRSQMPLLQMCAAMIGEPLIVYVPPITTGKQPWPDATLGSIVYAISATTADMTKNPADLDFWLQSRAMQVKGQLLNQGDLLWALGSTVGAHLDLNVHPSVDLLRSWNSEVEGVSLDFFIQYVCAVARVIMELSGRILLRTPK